MSSKSNRGASSRGRGSKKGSSGRQDSGYTAPTKLTKSALVLQETQTPRVTRRTRLNVEDSINNIDPTASLIEAPAPAPSPATTTTPSVTPAAPPAEPTAPTAPITTPNTHTAATSATGHRFNGAILTPDNTPPPSTISQRPAAPAAQVIKKTSASSNRGREGYAYSSEDDMVSDNDFVPSVQNSPGQATSTLPAEDETTSEIYDEAMAIVAAVARPAKSRAKSTAKVAGAKAASGTKERHIEEFTIKFWMKTGAAGLKKCIELQSLTSFLSMKEEVAKMLGVRPTSLELAYRFSFSKDKAPRSLATEAEWSLLIGDARGHRNKSQVKASNTQDSWSIDLFEATEFLEKSETGKKGKASRAAPAPANLAELVPHNAEAETSAVLKRKIFELEDKLGCTNHGGQYCLIPNKDILPYFYEQNITPRHIHVIDTERRAWAQELLQNTATFNRPSISLLTNILSRTVLNSEYRKQFTQARRRNIEPETPSRFIYNASPSPAMHEVPPSLNLNPSDNEAPVIRTPTLPTNPAGDLTAPITHSATSPFAQMPLDEWLIGLDDSSRRHKHKHYADLIEVFEENDVCTVGELLRYTRADLEGMGRADRPIQSGTAQRLLDWAREDVNGN